MPESEHSPRSGTEVRDGREGRLEVGTRQGVHTVVTKESRFSQDAEMCHLHKHKTSSLTLSF